jgi:hypothetical protein
VAGGVGTSGASGREGWRAQGYPHGDYPAIAEILEHAILPETGSLRCLRAAQLRTLAMGAGKTMLIGAIAAAEFALALE